MKSLMSRMMASSTLGSRHVEFESFMFACTYEQFKKWIEKVDHDLELSVVAVPNGPQPVKSLKALKEWNQMLVSFDEDDGWYGTDNKDRIDLMVKDWKLSADSIIYVFSAE